MNNPILKGFNPDPSIVRVGDDYYIATSTFEWYPGVQIHHSKDLVNWRLISRPLNREALLDMRGNPDSCGIWAPCLSYCDGLFYLVYTDVKRFNGNYKDAHNYITTSATIDGEWSDPVYVNSSGFDPSLFHDEDGRKWFTNMVWDHRTGKNAFGGILLQEYDAIAKKLVGPITNIFRGTEAGLTEAPHIYRRNGYYYLLTAEGGTGYEHRMTFARAKNIEGPYELDPQGYFLTSADNPDLVLQRSGHGDFVETPQGEIFAVHLSTRPLPGLKRSPLGRETAIQRAHWSVDGWLRLAHGNNQPRATLDAPDLAPHPWPGDPARDEFNSDVLPMHYQWLRTPYPENFYSLKDRPGYLRLYGKQSIGNTFEQALLARRQQAFCFTATTCVTFEPETFQQMAGITCYYNGQKFHYLYISHDDEHGKHLGIMSHSDGEVTDLQFPLGNYGSGTEGVVAVPEDAPIYLRAQVNFEKLDFLWSSDGENWQKIGQTLDYSIVSDEAGRGEGASFTGAFVGMACQDISGANRPADFDFFEYLEGSG
ncbi:glycoside hydrolase family 43 protein [Microbulbifer bruguierae]|uniref:Glycoside hydrolase family 43 protein n=1 Tax=Microbulbifer bruguierae TaxID=3029061 RepID=A0ABY8NHM0_9GAMM|nr:glycoside hydrolase family 43 protein [Microbulbifer bruguierae]WGL18313.1 glycoside hydrolase family 43 protein [Microbulbifer bruguierae]